MKNALNNQVGMSGDMFFWLVANLKQGGIYLIKQACGNDILASVYSSPLLQLHTIAVEIYYVCVFLNGLNA